jgi:hypothetical protein
MKTIYLILFTILLGALTQAQNIIKNGDFSLDTNNDGVGEYWEKGPVTPYAAIIDGVQVVYSPGSTCNQSQLFQEINIQNGKPETYTLSFDISSKESVHVLAFYTDNYCYPIKVIHPFGNKMCHYDITFTQQTLIIKKLAFISSETMYNWIALDNVVMTKYPNTGLTAINKVDFYDMGGNKLTEEPSKGYYIKVENNTSKTILK